VAAAGVPSTFGGDRGPVTWTPSKEELARYQDVLLDVTGGGAVVSQDEGVRVLEQSGLPQADLMQIWELSDVDQDGDLSAGEFFCAMTLVARRRAGAELPKSLPAELRERVLLSTSDGAALFRVRQDAGVSAVDGYAEGMRLPSSAAYLEEVYAVAHEIYLDYFRRLAAEPQLTCLGISHGHRQLALSHRVCQVVVEAIR